MIDLLLQNIGPNWPLPALWGSLLGFVTIMVVFIAGVGLASRTLSVGAVGGYTVFALYAVETQDQFLENILYVTLVLVIFGLGFKLWRTEGLPGGGG